jgi:cell filamentation protein
MYAVIRDPYCYARTNVLKNKRGLRDLRQLETFELAATTQRADEPLPAGRCTLTHYRAIHHHLFQDVYGWAGRYRTVRISKDGNMFCYPENIPTAMRSLFRNPAKTRFLVHGDADAFSEGAAHFLAELNAIHPFREGNGRAQLAFLSFLAHRAAWPLNLDRLKPECFLSAMIESFAGPCDALASQLRSLVG